MSAAIALKEMTCADYADQFLDSPAWRRLADEMHWSDQYSDELCLLVMKKEAVREGVLLVDEDEFDDGVFWETYKFMEKGLS